MKARWQVGGILILLLLAVTLGTAAAPRSLKSSGLFAPLEVGQRIGLKERAGAYEISVVPGVELGHKVIEVGQDYIMVQDNITGVTETRIPVYAVRAVTITRIGSR